MTYISHKLDIAENHVEGLELQWTGGVKRGLPLLQNITRKSIAVVVFCYNHCGEKDYWERKYTIGETGEPAEEEKEKMEREYSKTYAKKIIKKK